MLQVLRSQLDHKKKEMIYRFDYRNLAPLYADEKMKICTRRRPESPNKFDVWIEGRDGGLAVKATAEVGPELDDSDPTLVESSAIKSKPNRSPKQPYTPVKRFDLKSKLDLSLKDRKTPIHDFEMRSIYNPKSDTKVESSPIRKFETQSSLSHEIPEREAEAPKPPPESEYDAVHSSNAEKDFLRAKDVEVENAYGYTATEIAELNKRKYSKDADQDERFGW